MMKKIYISADTEGLNGVTSFNQVLPEYRDDYAQMRLQLHLELNALINGLKKAGVDEIVINDAHNTMTNITLSELPNDVTLISGKPKKVSMMYGLDNSFDAVIFFAYHAKATSNGVLAHTFNMFFKSVSLNGEKISEAKLNGIYAKIIGVPLVLASGDNVFCEELKNDLGDITTIETKHAICGTAAICKKNEILLNEYAEHGKRISSLPLANYVELEKYKLEVEFDTEQLAQQVSQDTNLKCQNAIISCESKDYIDVYTILQKISAVTTALHKIQIQ